MSLKIAMLLDNPYHPDLRVQKEAQTLSQAGHQVTIFAWDYDLSKNRPLHETVGGVEIYRIRVKAKRQLGFRQIPYFLAFAYRAYKAIGEGHFDVVHCHDLLNLPIGILIKVFHKIPLVYDAHEIYWIMEAKKYPGLVLRIIRSAEFFLLKWVDEFITVGPKRAKYYQEHYKKPIFIVGNWYQARTKNRELGIKYREALGIPADAFVVTYSGTLSRIRCIHTLLECVSIFAKEKKPIYIIMAGRGALENEIKNICGNYEQLRFVGWVDDLTPLYSASDAVVYLMELSHPYAHYNSPNNLYLSIAWAIPLIGVNAGEIGEIITSEETGMLVGDNNVESVKTAIETLFAHPELRLKIERNLLSLQDLYSATRFEQALYEVYQQSKKG